MPRFGRHVVAESATENLSGPLSRREVIRRFGLFAVCASGVMSSATGCSKKPTETPTAIDPWWDVIVAPSSEVPAISASKSSQIGGGIRIKPTRDYDHDRYFRYDGCHTVLADGDGVYAAPPEIVVPEIVTDAVDIEVIFRSGREGTKVIGTRIVVDGKLSHLQLLRFDAANGADYYFKHHFTSARVRHLKFEVDGANRFKGAVVGPHTILQRPKGRHQFRHTAIGDSLQSGGPDRHIGAEVSGDVEFMRWESHSRFQAALMGCDSYVNLGVGGTGWGAKVPGDPFAARIPIALAGFPHVLGFFGSRNDAGDEAHVLGAVEAALTQTKDVPTVIVSGPQQAGYDELNNLVQQGTRAAGRTWIDLNGVAASPSSNPTGHPTFHEQLKLARAAYSQVDMQKILTTVARSNAERQASLGVNLGVIDSFDRPDGGVGNSENGNPWNTSTYAGWLIGENALTNPTASDQVFCDIDPGVAFGSYSFTLGGAYSPDIRMCLFYVDGGAHVFLNSNGGSDNWRLWLRANNVSTPIATGTTDPGWAAGDVIQFAVTPGSTFTKASFAVSKNDVAVITVKDVELGPLVAGASRFAIGVNATSRSATLNSVTMTPSI